ncbi:unnamed protein product [Leptosia nina]|uniref:Non-structural maintenance of chromosomes element 4 n=1 Tax=Leptosia nina TaxID=320188 RepID=A0AAV1K140_9NEOP
MSSNRQSRLRNILQELSLEEDNDNNEERMQKTKSAVEEVKVMLAQGGVEERVRHPGESFLDSRVLRSASDLAVASSQAVSGIENKYDKHELAQHIRQNPNFWIFPFPREVPIVTSLHGTFTPTPPEQRPRARRTRTERQQASNVVKAPENVDMLEKTDEASEMVSRVHRFIVKACRSGPQSYYHLVLDPTSFSRTIENIYYLSFLVRDGLISVYENEECGLPFVQPVSAQAQQNSSGASKNQFIISMNMKQWRELTNAFGITRTMMAIDRM